MTDTATPVEGELLDPDDIDMEDDSDSEPFDPEQMASPSPPPPARPVTALTRRQPQRTQAQQNAITNWTPSFAISVEAAKNQVAQRRLFYREVMQPEMHYGIIPGTNDKPTLLKPGAELLLASMGLHPSYGPGETPSVVDLSGQHTLNEDGEHEPFVRHERKCYIWRQTGPGKDDRVLIAEGEGSCNSWEKKYRKVKGQRECPSCGNTTLMRSKYADRDTGEKGWYCNKNVGGCGENFTVDDPAITEQDVADRPNPYIADLDNTILKMANKRALVAACLNATACSDIFTQDMEDTYAARRRAMEAQGGNRAAAQPRNGGSQQQAPRQQQGNGNRQQAAPPSNAAPDPAKPMTIPCPHCGNKGSMRKKTGKDEYFCMSGAGGCGDNISGDEFRAAAQAVTSDQPGSQGAQQQAPEPQPEQKPRQRRQRQQAPAEPSEDDRPPIDAYEQP